NLLKKMIEKEKGGEVRSFIKLAGRFSETEFPAEAIATLRAAKALHPDKFTAAGQALLISLLFDANRPEDAIKEANEWLDRHSDPDDAARIIHVVNSRGNPDRASTLLARFSAETVDTHPELLEEYILLLLAQTREDEAY